LNCAKNLKVEILGERYLLGKQLYVTTDGLVLELPLPVEVQGLQNHLRLEIIHLKIVELKVWPFEISRN
jgi:hypothetical protein